MATDTAHAVKQAAPERRKDAGTVAAAPGPPAGGDVMAVRVVHDVTRTLEAIQEDLPRRSWPVGVALGGLVLIGVLDTPVALGLSAVYVAARYWPFPHREDQRAR